MDWSIVITYKSLILEGLRMTLLISACGIAGSFVVGSLLGSVLSSGSYLAPRFVRLYIEIMRNLPVVVKMVIFYFALGLDPILSGIMALVFHQGAYLTDVIASGFRSISKEQRESASVLGLDTLNLYLRILYPQVYKVSAPAITNQFIEVVKNSAICMIIGIQELTFMTQDIDHETFRGFEAATVATVLYLLIALFLSGTVGVIQKTVLGFKVK